MMSIAHQRKPINSVLLAIALLWTTCYGFPDGPPDNDEDVCRTRLPRHGVPPQTGPSPYVITTDRTTYQPGSLIRVTIESTFRRNFRGFYIQARLANDTGLVLDDKLQMLSDRALGEFMLPPPQDTKLHSCTQGINNAVSHSQNTDKSSVTVFWRAPSRPEPWIDQQRYPEPWIGPIRFVATVVESPREVFWTNTYSGIICEGEDFRPPTFTNCPASDITEFIRPDQSFSELIVIPWTSPAVAADDCDATRGEGTSLTSSYDPRQGFPIGTTPFEYVVSDSSGNVNTCSFNVILQTDISECASSPCGLNGVCTDGFNGYRCTCQAGWAGVRCRININECASTPCMNGGTCFDGINGYTCQCLARWTGFRCEIQTVLPISCVPNPCPNSQICTPNGDSFTCSNDLIPPVVTCPNDVFRTTACNTGGIQVTYQVPTATDNSGTATLVSNTHNGGQFFTGGDTSVTYTYSDPSGNRASCSFTVTVTGDDNEPPICTPPDDIQRTISFGSGGTIVTWTEPRATDNCGIVTLESRTHAPGDFFNDGRTRVTYTYVDGSQNRVTCGFDVLITEVDPDFPFSCAISPCRNGGQCVNAINGQECICLAGWIGVRCEMLNDDECANSPCQNGGACIDGINGYTCQCIGGWTGVNCEIPTGINECATSCVNGACIDENNGYTCQCFTGWIGVNCENNYDECASNPCQNGATCIDGINGYTCQCIGGWTGVNCENTIDECASSPCRNGGICFDGINSYTCQCIGRWTGVNCEFPTDINECASGPCVNGACIDENNGYTCQCFTGWTGVNCETNNNECASSPCRNGGICFDGINGYTCQCIGGWTGVNCESDINNCASAPCQNGACVDGINGYTCQCFTGWTGVNCETRQTPCASQPCEFGVCNEATDGGYECVCQNGYSGSDCDILIRSCDSQPCVNENERCYDDGGDGYICVCLDGYSGVNCQNGPCDSQPCVKGICDDNGGGGYTCTCVDGYTGVNCQNGGSDYMYAFISCIGDITELVDRGVGGTSVRWTEPAVIGDRSGISLASRSHVPGYFFPVGSTRVSYTFTDGQSSAVCGFNVIVNEVDTEPPVVDCNFGTVTEIATNAQGAVVFWLEPTATDNSGSGVSSVRTHAPGSFFPVGVTGVTYTFTDRSGNNAECFFSVVVSLSDRPTCAPNPCRNSGTCVESVGGIFCLCPPRIRGDRCEIAPPRPPPACDSSPCLNGGTCMNSEDNTGGFICMCTPGFVGPTCRDGGPEFDCVNNPCSNGGMCVDLPAPGGYVCNCQPGFFGATCEIGPCASSPCLNGGFCQDMVGQGVGSTATFACICDVGFTGDRCEYDNIPPDVTDCPASIARTIGTGAGGTTMTWTEPYATDNSGVAFIQSRTHIAGQTFFPYGSTEVTYTFSDTSQNIATCLFVVTIEERVPAPDPCDSYPCLNGGSCKVFLDNGIFCYCTNGFEGDLCETRVPAPDPCVSSPCMNGGSCKVLLDNGFVCFCTNGFEGDRCETREMSFNLTSSQMKDFENNYINVRDDLPKDDNGVVMEGALSNPVYYGLNVVPKLTEAQKKMILDEFPDIFIDEQVVINEVEGRQGRRRRQSMSQRMSQRICPVRYENRTNLVTISGNDRSNPKQNTQLVQVNNMIQWAFNAECLQSACHDVQAFNNGDLCKCKEEKHTVSALVYNINIQAGAASGIESLSMTLKQIDVYTCDGKI